MKQEAIHIVGMTCAGCVSSVKNVIQRLAGVEQVEVSLKDEQAKVTFDESKLSTADIARAVESAGYAVAA